jgi:signal transduction histidine kinase
MWSRVAQIALRARIQHRRIRGAAGGILAVRLLEGAAAWAVLCWFFGRVTVPMWAVHVNFTVYGVANLLLFRTHRRQTLTPRLVWFDIAANLLPMAAAAHWSGGIYSPLVPIFVLKIGNYALVYGVDVGVQSLAATAACAMGLAAIEYAGFGPAQSLEGVPFVVRQRLTLAFAGLIFAIGVGGSFRLFRTLQEREARLADVVREKDRLYQESLRHQQHLRRLSRRIMQVSEGTMRRLARELHDDLGQALTAIKMDLGLIDRALSADSPVRPHVREVREQIGLVLQSVRNLSQLLRPAVLDDLGLVPAIESYITRFSERTGILVTLEAPTPETRLPRALEVALYRVLQEALTNVARHAAAPHVRVHLGTSREAVALEIADDGCGFDAARFLEAPPADHGMGVLGMRERVATYGGRFAIESAPGAGTRVALTISLAQGTAALEEDDGADARLAG